MGQGGWQTVSPNFRVRQSRGLKLPAENTVKPVKQEGVPRAAEGQAGRRGGAGLLRGQSQVFGRKIGVSRVERE